MNWSFKHTLILFLLTGLTALLLIFGNESKEIKSTYQTSQVLEPSSTATLTEIREHSSASVASAIKASLQSIEQNSEEVKVDVSEYYQLNGEQIYRKLAMMPENSAPPVSDILLALLEQGILSPTTAIKIDQNGFEYSVLFTALVLEPSITAEKVETFLQYGNNIGSDELWLDAITRVSTQETTQLLLEQAIFGPEHKERLMLSALISGNQELFEYVEQSGEVVMNSELAENLKFNVMSMSNEAINHFDEVLTNLESYNAIDFAEDKSWLQDSLFRLNVLKNNSYIDNEEQLEVSEKITQLQELLDRLEQSTL